MKKKRGNRGGGLAAFHKRQKESKEEADLQTEGAVQPAKSAVPAATTGGAGSKTAGRPKGQKDGVQRKRRMHALDNGDVQKQTPTSKRIQKSRDFFSPASEQEMKSWPTHYRSNDEVRSHVDHYREARKALQMQIQQHEEA